MNKELCRTLNVGHELLVPVDDASVSVRLTNANGDAACYEDGLYNGMYVCIAYLMNSALIFGLSIIMHELNVGYFNAWPCIIAA